MDLNPIPIFIVQLDTVPTSNDEVISLCESLQALDTYLQVPEPEHEQFLSALAILSSDFLLCGYNLFDNADLTLLSKTLQGLSRFFVNQLKKGHGGLPQGYTVKDFLAPLSAFCSGSPFLGKTEQSSLVKLINKVPVPPYVSINRAMFSYGEDSFEDPLAQKSQRLSSSSVHLDSSRPQTDLTPMLMEQLIRPIDKEDTQTESSGLSGTVGGGKPFLARVRNRRLALATKCTQQLQTLGVGDVVIELGLNLPLLSTYIARWKDLIANKGPHEYPATHSEALSKKLSFPELACEIDITLKALTLPLMEPLTSNRISKLCQLVMGCMMACVAVATTQSVLSLNTNLNNSGMLQASSSARINSTKEEELDQFAVEIVEKSLELLNSSLSLVRDSTRAGGHVLQNMTLLAAWTLTTGLNVQLEKSNQMSDKKDVKSKESPASMMPVASRTNLMKAQQGFGVLSVALASQSLSLIGTLFEDAAMEAGHEEPSADQINPSSFDLFHPFTATQRVALIFQSVQFVQLLFNLSIIAFRKSCSLKTMLLRMSGSKEVQAKTLVTSTITDIEEDTTTDDDQNENVSEYNDSDNDSEPLLGKWFEETLFPPEEPSVQENEANKEEPDSNDDDSASNALLVPDKGEPSGFISLASHVFIFMNKHLISSESEFVRSSFQSNLTEQQMSVLASLTKDVDFEALTAKKMEYHLVALYSEFSTSLFNFTHNLMAFGLLNEKLQSVVLTHLNVQPEHSDRDWPLRVGPRTLAFLSQALMLRQKNDQKTTSPLFIVIWERVLSTLTKHILFPPPDDDALNVEQAQLLLFFFHALTLMQKKHVLLQTALSLIKASKVINRFDCLTTNQVLHISKLLLLFEYIMRNLYEPPEELMEQIQYNIFKRYQNKSLLHLTPKFFAVREISNSEESDCDSPLFFNLFRAPDLASVVQEVPKLDGLASSFLLSSQEVFQYHQIYEALAILLQVVHQVEMQKEVGDGNMLKSHAAIQWCFNLSWRVLQSLPPSVEYLEALVSHSGQTISPCSVLHSLTLGPRTKSRLLAAWIKDSLVKQGHTMAKAESLMKNVAVTLNDLATDVKILKHYAHHLKQKDFLISSKSPKGISQNSPEFVDLLVLDFIVSKLQISLDINMGDPKSASRLDRSGPPPDFCSANALTIREIAPLAKEILESLLMACKAQLLTPSKAQDSLPCLGEITKDALMSCLAVSGTKCTNTSKLSTALNEKFHPNLKSKLQEWSDISLLDFSSSSGWRGGSSSDSIPFEPYLSTLLKMHLSGLNRISPGSSSHVLTSLKRCLYAATKFCSELYVACPDSELQEDLLSILFPLAMDGCADFLSDLTVSVQLAIVNEGKHTQLVIRYVLSKVYGVLLLAGKHPSEYFNSELLEGILDFIITLTETEPGRTGLDSFFSSMHEYDLTQILMTITSPNVSTEYAKKVLTIFVKIFEALEKNPREQAAIRLCSTLARLSQVPSSELEAWLHYIVQGTDRSTASMETDLVFLKSLSKLVALNNSPIHEDVAQAFLKALIPMASSALTVSNESTVFVDLLSVMSTLASAGSGSGHIKLFRSSNEWLEICKNYLVQKNVVEKLEIGNTVGKHMSMVENACHLLLYIAEILSAIQFSVEHERSSPTGGVARPLSPNEGEASNFDIESDWTDDLGADDDDSAGDDSDDDSLCNMLCTYTHTQKEFFNQHWYHCHTCKMVDGVGVCSVCAKVCHADHDVTYSKFGSFFCDCGAKEDGSCIAMTKRSSPAQPCSTRDQPDARRIATSVALSAGGYEAMVSNHSRRRPMSPTSSFKEKDCSSGGQERTETHKAFLAQRLACYKDVLLDTFQHTSVALDVLHLLCSMLPVIEATGEKYTCYGKLAELKGALESLQSIEEMTVEPCDQLMNPTLGSKEGAFENVRMNYSGDQGQQIRQLLTANMVRRVVMCCMTSGALGKRQHLAVAHEKGRITVLQLSTLLRQVDLSQKKPTLTRLTSAPVPFTVLSVVSNPINSDYLAVTGLKDCHVLTISPSGNVSDHLVLHPQLDANNFIIKALWIPGTQTKLALVTADFVKIYDLGQDALSPQYFLLVPSGKVRDCTVAYLEDGKHYVLIMSSAGHIYYQPLSEESHAEHGSFYVTNILNVKHHNLTDFTAQIGGGGVSIYYYHSLGLLFFSFVEGQSFMAPLRSMTDELENVIKLDARAKGSSPSQPLCQWAEVPGHPGLLTAFQQASNTPVVIMVKPERIMCQEIKVNSKSKVIDIVALRHMASSQEQKTTLILLCEDGSLKIFLASYDSTNFWLRLNATSSGALLQVKPPRKRKAQKIIRLSGTLSFPVDFFETCSPITDVEFGGNDVLQVYNVQQLKHRLQTTGLYIANTKQGGFTLEVTNNDASQVIVGIRIHLGTQDVRRCPSYIEVFGRTHTVSLSRPRWFDIPLAREESIQADKKVQVVFGPSIDPSHEVLIDNVVLFGKSKDSFGWTEEQDDQIGPSGLLSQVGAFDVEETRTGPLNPVERLTISCLDILNGYFHLSSHVTVEDLNSMRKNALELTSELVILPTSKSIEQLTKSVMASLFPNRLSYYAHKDKVLLKSVLTDLQDGDLAERPDGGVESFHRLLICARAVAVTRPQHLIKLAEVPGWSDSARPAIQVFMMELTNWFWQLLASRPANATVGTLGHVGLTHVEVTVHCLVEIFHAITTVDFETVPLATQLYAQLLMAEQTQVSFAAKQALIRAMKPKLKRRKAVQPSPPPDPSPSKEARGPKRVGNPVAETPQAPSDADANINIGPGGIPLGGVAGNLEAMLPLAGAANIPNVIEDMAGDVDDEAMVELAIALSLQEQQGEEGLQGLHQGLQRLQGIQQGLEQLVPLVPDLHRLPGLQGLAGMLGGAIGNIAQDQPPAARAGEGVAPQEPSHFSDPIASVPASDDEEGSTARTPPGVEPDQASAAGSESGGSVIDGDQAISGRSSAYEPELLSASGKPTVEESYTVVEEESENEINGQKLHALRLRILEQLQEFVPQLRDVGGVRSIPFMQTILMLTSEVDFSESRDKLILDNLLQVLIDEIILTADKGEELSLCERSNFSEMQLVVLRLFSVIMSRSKTWQPSKPNPNPEPSLGFVSHRTAAALVSAGFVDHCLNILTNLLKYWKSKEIEDNSVKVGSSLLKNQPLQSPPDMSPFFLKQYVKSNNHDVFEAFPQLLTEMALKLPYQIKKISEAGSSETSKEYSIRVHFDETWFNTLCEYMMVHQTPYVRRQVRKLLLYICGNKDKYRFLRDVHSLGSHMESVRHIITSETNIQTDPNAAINLSYDTLLLLIEHLKACVDVSTTRARNWQRFCLQKDYILPFLFRISFGMEEGVSSIILQLLQGALAASTPSTSLPGGSSSGSSSSSRAFRFMRVRTSRGEKSKSDEQEEDEDSESLSIKLVKLVNQHVSPKTMSKFVERFLLECNATTVRWQAHALIVTLQKYSPPQEQETMLDVLWSLWQQLPFHGRKAAQFVDLLGYFSMNTLKESGKVSDYVDEAVEILKAQNRVMDHHPNTSIYSSLSQLVDFNGYYLESDPCLVCNTPEVPYSSLKLSSLKADTKYTTTTHIVKLSGSFSVSKITLRIGDLKRQKMVRSINIFYNNRSVQAVVELKNRPTTWHKAKKVSLTAGQTDIKVEFPLPIVACNLMIEYSDFYENIQASSETLQCPRCSASVPANPGVCGNCGENVFQCHKCRSINYDEKDPFLCNACGFCKYAKFDYTLHCRPCCSVDPIESEEDRKKSISTINNLLDNADKVYKQLASNRPHLESSILKISESSSFADLSASNPSSSGVPGAYVNVHVQQLAQRYCGDCRNLFDDLSKITQKVTATRKELLCYDNSKRGLSRGSTRESWTVGNTGRCYGCAAASVEHCLTLLRALAANPKSRHLLCQKGLISELLEQNLRRGSPAIRNEVRKLICFLTKDNPEATARLNNLLFNKISLSLQIQSTYCDLIESVRHEMALLAYTVQKEDSCWEDRLRCVFKIFLMSTRDRATTPTIVECVTLPCLKIMQTFIKPPVRFRKVKDGRPHQEVKPNPAFHSNLMLSVDKWLQKDQEHSFQDWSKRATCQGKSGSMTKENKAEVRRLFLMQKYFQRWYESTHLRSTYPLAVMTSSWLKSVLFNPTSKAARQVACNMIDSFCNIHLRKKDIIDLLTSFLDDLANAGESAGDFCTLYQRLISTDHWQYYLAINGTLGHIAELITQEIDQLNVLETTTLSSDLAQGFTLKTLVDILANFVADEKIKASFKSRLVSNVLHGYLSLRRLVVQRTKLVDQTQDKLLELLEDMTTGTEEETKAFMAVCVRTIQRYPMDDQLTPVFIFERLCNIIYPEETDTGEFFLMLEKDPQQEDFLHGRMLGNPYNSNDPDLGPLMREIKNKICRDCELVALLEDDNGMELLVCNKIISLDLPVKDVYQKVWLHESQEGEPMRIIYRMRGLLGDATEEFIENLESKDHEDQDEEEVYHLANVMADCGGLEVMIARMESITDTRYAHQMLSVLLKLFGHCIKVRKNRDKLLKPSLRTIPTLLNCLKLTLRSGSNNHTLSEAILHVMDTLLVYASSQPHANLEKYVEFASASTSERDIETLLERAVHLKTGTEQHQCLMRVLPFLTYGSKEKMSLVIRHFDDIMDFEAFDNDHGAEKDAKMQTFVAMCDGIERTPIGNTMKMQMLELGILKKCIDYVEVNAPRVSSVVVKNDDPRWKDFAMKPSLKYVLQMMSGLAADHTPTQIQIASATIPLLHQMEQVSSEEHVGSLAEAVLESLRGCEEAEKKIKTVRDQTKAEKKKLAMAMREKQLKAFGLKANAQGQVQADSSLLQKFVGLAEESGLCCNICRDGYNFQPKKALAIYTFTVPCPIEEAEPTSRKTMGYSTVSHFNLVHVDCHSTAVRQARGRDEWESAMLQNANTRCNGLLPIWGPNVPESVFASCLAKYNTSLSEVTHNRDIGYQSTLHDLKLLLLRFAQDRSFSEDSGGGGPQSNMHLTPYILHLVLYVLNTTRATTREDKNLMAFLDQPRERWIESCYVTEGPFFYTVMAMALLSPAKWKTHRLRLLQRLLLAAHLRKVSPRPPKTLEDKNVKDYETYKATILFFALIDQIYSLVFNMIPLPEDCEWPVQLADWIRKNDDELSKLMSKVLSTFQEDLLPSTSIDEIIDVCGLLEDIPSPASFLIEVLAMVP